LFLDRAKFRASFAADVDAERAAFMADSQVPWGVEALSGKISEPAWKTNPARTFGSALHANYWHALWIYFIAPSMGMLAAGEVFLRVRRGAAPYCAKLHHANNERCIFHHSQHEV
jgi:hypothetical protein